MARVPVVVDEEELEAYSYLRPPAYILRAEGEDEIQAIARIRQSHRIGSSNHTSEASVWQKYEEQLYNNNSIVLAQALEIDLDQI